ncbi:MAG: Gfo/Idh/MocA family oxidoreductase, partial [Ilumatobacteraceae bacterium]|nr:Gfo/Idh/MocA family oxidoreductase [Ilumatobacteraceae bacterium]
MTADRRDVRVGIVGYGIMGKAHSYGYRVAPMLYDLPVRPVVAAISGRNATAVEAAARAYEIASFTTDWRTLIDDPTIDIIDICTPPGTHAEIAIAAAAAGKAILCEKPLAASYADAASAAEAATSAGVLNAVGFNYRRLPALALMQRMITDGVIGEVLLWRANWMSDEFADPAIPFDWRFDRTMGGTTIADLGCHLFDMALWMVGDVERVSAQTSTFTLERSTPDGPRAVTVDEAASALLRFDSGAAGTLEVGRTAVRRPCDMTVEVNGTHGTLVFDYARLNELKYGTDAEDPQLYGMRTIRAEEASHPYAAHWWPIGQGVGYGASFVNQVAGLLESWPDGPWSPDFHHGCRV